MNVIKKYLNKKITFPLFWILLLGYSQYGFVDVITVSMYTQNGWMKEFSLEEGKSDTEMAEIVQGNLRELAQEHKEGEFRLIHIYNKNYQPSLQPSNLFLGPIGPLTLHALLFDDNSKLRPLWLLDIIVDISEDGVRLLKDFLAQTKTLCYLGVFDKRVHDILEDVIHCNPQFKNSLEISEGKLSVPNKNCHVQ